VPMPAFAALFPRERWIHSPSDRQRRPRSNLIYRVSESVMPLLHRARLDVLVVLMERVIHVASSLVQEIVNDSFLRRRLVGASEPFNVVDSSFPDVGIGGLVGHRGDEYRQEVCESYVVKVSELIHSG